MMEGSRVRLKDGSGEATVLKKVGRRVRLQVDNHDAPRWKELGDVEQLGTTQSAAADTQTPLGLLGRNLFVQLIGGEGECQSYHLSVRQMVIIPSSCFLRAISTIYVCCPIQNGDLLCTLEGCYGDMRVVKLKQLVEENTGKDAELMRLFHEHGVMNNQETLEASGIPNQTELYVSYLVKLVVADYAGIPARKLTSSILAGLCVELAEAPPDILDLNGCEGITDISCLAQFDALSTLSLSGCSGITGSMIQGCLQAMPGLLQLNVSNCALEGAYGENGEYESDDCALVADALHGRYDKYSWQVRGVDGATIYDKYSSKPRRKRSY
jgi:hypothetical protein